MKHFSTARTSYALVIAVLLSFTFKSVGTKNYEFDTNQISTNEKFLKLGDLKKDSGQYTNLKNVLHYDFDAVPWNKYGIFDGEDQTCKTRYDYCVAEHPTANGEAEMDFLIPPGVTSFKANFMYTHHSRKNENNADQTPAPGSFYGSVYVDGVKQVYASNPGGSFDVINGKTGGGLGGISVTVNNLKGKKILTLKVHPRFDMPNPNGNNWADHGTWVNARWIY